MALPAKVSLRHHMSGFIEGLAMPWRRLESLCQMRAKNPQRTCWLQLLVEGNEREKERGRERKSQFLTVFFNSFRPLLVPRRIPVSRHSHLSSQVS